MIRVASRLALVAVFSLIALSASAKDYKLGPLTIAQPWARATPGAIKTGAVYLTVTTQGDSPDRLIGAETPRAGKAGLHAQIMDGDVMRMRDVKAVEVNPGEPAVLKPGGLHIMLEQLAAPLREKDRFPLTLIFEKAGRIDVDVAVQSVGAMDAGRDMQGM
jgi:copper(I)-binding protein